MFFLLLYLFFIIFFFTQLLELLFLSPSLLLEEGISGGRFLWSMQSNVSRKFVFIYKLTHVSCIPIQNETYHFSIWKCSILVTFFFLLLYTFGTRWNLYVQQLLVDWVCDIYENHQQSCYLPYTYTITRKGSVCKRKRFFSSKKKDRRTDLLSKCSFRQIVIECCFGCTDVWRQP